MSANSINQVSCVLDDIISKVVKKHKRVTWMGITKVSLFEIENDRKLTRKPISKIRIMDKEKSHPFILPEKIPNKELPIEGQLWNNHIQVNNTQTGNSRVFNVICSEKKEHYYPTFKSGIFESRGVMCDYPDPEPKLPRSRPILLSEVYDIVNNMEIIDDYNKFIYKTSDELQVGINK
jgi:hypothetical protein